MKWRKDTSDSATKIKNSKKTNNMKQEKKLQELNFKISKNKLRVQKLEKNLKRLDKLAKEAEARILASSKYSNELLKFIETQDRLYKEIIKKINITSPVEEAQVEAIIAALKSQIAAVGNEDFELLKQLGIVKKHQAVIASCIKNNIMGTNKYLDDVCSQFIRSISKL